jgi:PTH1 family peptidyl-tRNA hydrolase
MEQVPPIRLVVGLGNPGKTYERTRHNIGFLVADELCRRAGMRWSSVSKWRCELAEQGAFALMKPLTFMNLSGESVGAFSRFHKVPAERILLVVDDVALPTGRLRLRREGSSGGHNGLESTIAHLGTPAFPRLRVGIGSARGGSLPSHVLGRFTTEETPEIEAAVARAADAIDCIQTRGFEAAMNQFNSSLSHPS